MHYVKVKGILSAQNGMNLYRGCTHGCIYCDSRSDCYQMSHPFEDIEVKENALILLEYALRHKRKKCMIGCGSMSDPYMPLESKLKYVQKSLQLALKYGFGYSLITKSKLVLRDIDLLQAIQEANKCVVSMTLTTSDESLCQILEPHVCTSHERFQTLLKLRDANIPCVVWLCPILPFINDTIENIDKLLDYCIEARVYGVLCFGMGVTLRGGNREYFYQQLDRFFPHLKAKYIATYGQQYILNSPHHRTLMAHFHNKCEKYGIVHNNDAIFKYMNTMNGAAKSEQLRFF